MKKILRVDLLSWDRPEQSDPNIDVWFTYKEGDAAVEIHSVEANEHYLKSIPVQGITGRLGKQYYLTDGMKFMEELKYAFTGSRIRASEIIEIIDGKRPEEPEPEEEAEELEETEYDEFGEDEFLDGAVNILKNKRKCLNCKHLHKNEYTCKAFPNGIPEVFLTCQQEHLKPSKKYHQKNKIVWQEDLNQTWLARQRKRDKEIEIKVINFKTDQDKAIRIMEKLKKEGWEADIRSYYDYWPQQFTVFASRKKKKVS